MPAEVVFEDHLRMNPAPIVTLFVEARLLRDRSGLPASTDSAMIDAGWASALPGIESLRLAARVSRDESENALALRGEVFALPYYVGVCGLVRALPSLAIAIDRAVSTSDIVVARLPGIIGFIAVVSAVFRRKIRAVEVVGDIGEVLRVGVAGTIGRLLAPVAEGAIIWSVGRAMAVRYVTDRVLQEKYPARKMAETVALSSVKINEIVEQRNLNLVQPGLILAVGSLEQLYKGHQHLISAIAALRNRWPAVRLEIIGEGRYRDHLEQVAANLEISDYVSFLGYISDRDELHARMDACQVFAMPSLTEGLPRVLIEAMARSVPCVGTRVGGIPELLDDSMLSNAGDSSGLSRVIETLLESADLCAQQASKNSKVAERFTSARLSRNRRLWSEAVVSLNNGSQ